MAINPGAKGSSNPELACEEGGDCGRDGCSPASDIRPDNVNESAVNVTRLEGPTELGCDPSRGSMPVVEALPTFHW